jgi:hypothetical protein
MNPAIWLEDFCLVCQAGGANDDYFIIRYLPICVGEFVRAWLEFLPPNSICSWVELKQVFVVNFQGTYMRPGNSWDLKSCKQEPGEYLRDYIWRFSKLCNSLPDVCWQLISMIFTANFYRISYFFLAKIMLKLFILMSSIN